MKPVILFILISFACTATAQQKQPVAKDSLPAKLSGKKSSFSRRANVAQTVETEIEAGLNKIVSAYINQPNIQAT